MREIQDSQLSQSRQLPPGRRALMAWAGVTCAAMLAGCTTRDANDGGVTPAASATATSADGSAPATGGSAATVSAPATGGSAATVSAPAPNILAATSQIPDGGGKIIAGNRIVITQPRSRSFKAFSAICTHEGCFVNSVSNGTINCPCHGSEFSIKDGSVVRGPATRPLAPIAIKVEGTSIFQG